MPTASKREIKRSGGRRQAATARAIGYVRVSRVGGRGGDSFISPAVQREQIAAAAAARGLELIGLEEDMDESGGKYDRPGFQRALGRIEAGDATVIVVARLTRFARSVLDTHRALERIEATGGRLVAADVDVDTSTATGRLIRGVLATLAEFELELAREQWATAKSRAVGRGVKIAPVAPYGYRFDDDHRLEPTEPDAAVVRELFEARAGGETWAELLERFNAHAPAGRRPTRRSVRIMIQNRAYVGSAIYGELENTAAHEPIVTEELFEAAQAPSRRWRESTNRTRFDTKVKTLLSGIARCGACGTGLGRKYGGGSAAKIPYYRCTNHRCPAPAVIREDELDAYVVGRVMDWAGAAADQTIEVARPAGRRGELEQRLADLQLSLEAYVTSPDQFGLEPAIFDAGVRARQAAIEALRAELAELAEHDELGTIRTTLRQAWPALEVSEQRRLLTIIVGRLIVRRAAFRGEPGIERTELTFRDTAANDPLELG